MDEKLSEFVEKNTLTDSQYDKYEKITTLNTINALVVMFLLYAIIIFGVVLFTYNGVLKIGSITIVSIEPQSISSYLIFTVLLLLGSIFAITQYNIRKKITGNGGIVSALLKHQISKTIETKKSEADVDTQIAEIEKSVEELTQATSPFGHQHVILYHDTAEALDEYITILKESEHAERIIDDTFEDVFGEIIEIIALRYDNSIPAVVGNISRSYEYEQETTSYAELIVEFINIPQIPNSYRSHLSVLGAAATVLIVYFFFSSDLATLIAVMAFPTILYINDTN